MTQAAAPLVDSPAPSGLCRRIIPCLDVNAGRVVKGVNFVNLTDAGDPVEIARRYDEQGADEITFLDITATSDDRDLILPIIEAVARQVFIPLTVGGGVRQVADVQRLLDAGADKVSINSAAIARPELVAEAARHHGSQCIVVALDARRVSGADEAPEGAVAEMAPARSALMAAIAERLARHGGAGLFIDYGYLEPGIGDTFQALRRHRHEDVLQNPGEADLTAHVDFAALAAAARAQGLHAGLTTQGAFLLALGLLERAGRLGGTAGEAGRERISDAVERLAGPQAMGDLFKVMAVLPKGVAVAPFDGGN